MKVDIFNTEQKYKVIYADPPWKYDDKSLNRGGAERHYRTTANHLLCDLPQALLMMIAFYLCGRHSQNWQRL